MSEVSTNHTDQSARYENKNSFIEKVEAVGEALPISGVTFPHDWETLHPASNAPVVGVVAAWKVDSARMAAVLSAMNKASGAKAAQASSGVKNGTGSASQGGSGPASKPSKADAYQGQGNAARDF